MKLIRRITISLGVLFFTACCGAVLLFNWHALGWRALSVQTGSMRPATPRGSLVLVHSVPNSSLKVGDVITYASPHDMRVTITHRIIKAYKLDGKIPAYITKGDANLSADPVPVVGGLVIGRAVWHVPYIGRAMDWSKTWFGLAVLVYLPAFLIMFGATLDMADYLRKFQVYELRLVPKIKKRHFGRRTAGAAMSFLLLILVFGAVAWPVQALLRSNTVALGNNRLSTAAVTPPSTCGSNTTTTVNNPGTGTGSTTNNNSVSVTNTNSQTANTGNASNSNNTNGGSAASGNATNTNCTSTTITITNH